MTTTICMVASWYHTKLLYYWLYSYAVHYLPMTDFITRTLCFLSPSPRLLLLNIKQLYYAFHYPTYWVEITSWNSHIKQNPTAIVPLSSYLPNLSIKETWSITGRQSLLKVLWGKHANCNYRHTLWRIIIILTELFHRQARWARPTFFP